ncbi:MAG TPA: AbrB/MazE/SpoVT family DNA-binding domain-containing protein [Gemmatimonadota bacterium]|jgi:AbrB family looped-hinge helix DNA binding protein|nr:AbrB/MazE/SpoVT family DNA-binding domain-containing protein [Gemmatimonadota bacterium]
MKTKVSERGQVTIPKKIRKRLGIRPGQVLEVDEERGRVVMSKIVQEDVFERLTGILKLDKSTDELIDEMRGPAALP